MKTAMKRGPRVFQRAGTFLIFLPMAMPMKIAMKAKKAPGSKRGATMKTAMKRSMKAKVVSKIAKGLRAKSSVFAGRKEKTSGGLKQSDLARNKNGKVVSKKMSANSKKRWATSKLKKWADAVKKARKALAITGFCAIGGGSAKGKALYAKARSFLD